jgi:Phytanoyl-CoA dioxygenase (PhyH)
MKLSPAELAGQKLNDETQHFAVQQIRNNGYILFEGVLPTDLVAEMHKAFMRWFEAYASRADSNRGTNRYQMHVPFASPFTDPQIFASPFVIPIIDALVGEDCVCHYFASDTPLPGSDYQDAHADIYQLFPETSMVMPPYSIVVNIPLVDFREDNGPLEIWPGGTHHYVAGKADIPALAAAMHSEHVLMAAGSILIRDSRMWHRGTPNRSNAARPNFALIYSRYWLKLNYPPIAIPRDTYDSLPDRAKKLFRLENIGAPALTY